VVALAAIAGILDGLKGRDRSANLGEASRRASNASERAQRAAGAERVEGFLLFLLTPPL
jgi:hypothetical protein